MASHRPRARRMRFLGPYGVPALLVALVVLFLAVSTQTLWPRASQVDAQAEPTATSISLQLHTPTPMPTARVVRTRTPITNVVVAPTRTPRALPTPSPTQEPTRVPVKLPITAESWKGGYFQGNALYYGRPWTAIYGSQSDYPRATLVLTLTDDPTEAIQLFVTGLDDELPAKCKIVLEVNAQRVYQGESWFENWDGVGTGQNAAWTTVMITIPPELLVKGNNRISLRNFTEAANFGTPPYFLLAEGEAMSTESEIFGPAPATQVTVVVVSGSDTGFAQSNMHQ